MFEQSLKTPQGQVPAVPAAARMGSPSGFPAFLVAPNILTLYPPSPSSREQGNKYKSRDTTFLQQSCVAAHFPLPPGPIPTDGRGIHGAALLQGLQEAVRARPAPRQTRERPGLSPLQAKAHEKDRPKGNAAQGHGAGDYQTSSRRAELQGKRCRLGRQDIPRLTAQQAAACRGAQSPGTGPTAPCGAGHAPVGPGQDAEEQEVCSCWLQERNDQRCSPDIVRGVVGLLQEDTERGLLASQGHGTLRGHLLVSVLDGLGEVERQVLCGGVERENCKAAASL